MDTILNDKSKNPGFLGMNWFFAATLLVTIFTIICHAVTGGGTWDGDVRPEWNSFSWSNLFLAVSRAYIHANWQHCLLNMLCFFIAGIYLERKRGSLGMLLLVAVLSFFSAFATAANYVSLSPRGFSGVNYALYGYIIVDYVFVLLVKERRYKFNVVSGGVILGLIYFAMCFNGGTTSVSFVPYPSDFLHNIGHASGFFVGLLFGTYEMCLSLIIRRIRTFETY